VHLGHDVGIDEVELVEAGIDEHPFLVEIGAHPAVEDDDLGAEPCAEVRHPSSVAR